VSKIKYLEEKTPTGFEKKRLCLLRIPKAKHIWKTEIWILKICELFEFIKKSLNSTMT